LARPVQLRMLSGTVQRNVKSMTATKPDRRTERTRTALLRAFVDLVLEHGYDSVTVEGVAERANVGRSTFYVHYKGKEDILRKSMAHPSSNLARILDEDVTPERVVPQLVHFYEQRRVNRVFFNWPIRPIWVRTLAEFIEPRLTAKIKKTAGLQPLLPVGLIALYIAEAQIGLVTHWLLDRYSPRPDAVAEALVATTRANAVALLRVTGA